jgi:hypothetical protein
LTVDVETYRGIAIAHSGSMCLERSASREPESCSAFASIERSRSKLERTTPQSIGANDGDVGAGIEKHHAAGMTAAAILDGD